MITASLLVRVAWASIASVLVNFAESSPAKTLNVRLVRESAISREDTTPRAAVPCKVGFKRGKTPVSLVTGAKPGCVSTKASTAGKKLLTQMGNVCYACHSSMGISPAASMLTKLKNQSFTLKPADITAAFNLHVSEMAGASMTSKQAKEVGAYLQTLKMP